MYEEYKQVVKTLNKEIELLENSLSLENPAGRRIMIRSVFTALESQVSLLCYHLVNITPPYSNETPDGKSKFFFEISTLSNQAYRISDKGTVEVIEPRITLRNKALFALDISTRIYGTKLSPKEIDGWNEFLDFIKIRNRVTHPKNLNDIEISEQEYNKAIKALKWYVICQELALGQKSLPDLNTPN